MATVPGSTSPMFGRIFETDSTGLRGDDNAEGVALK